MKYFRSLSIFLLMISGMVRLFAQQVPIGQWRDELPYTLVNAVTDGGDRTYASTPYAVFYVDKADNSVVRITKISGLSDIGISTINYNREYKTLVIAYSNANIDLIKNNTIINISDIKRKQILGNKTINNIYFIGKDAYLSCGFGIVVLDISKEEIRDTYYIGNNGSQVNVLALTKDQNDTLFAASDKGLYKASINDPNLANFTSWHKDRSIDSTATYSTITWFEGSVFVNKKKGTGPSDTIYKFSNGSWSRWEQSSYDPVMHIESNDKYLVVSYDYFVKAFNTGLDLYMQIPCGPFPLYAIADHDGIFWTGDKYTGLYSFNPGTGGLNHINLSGPNTGLAFGMAAIGNDLYIVPGGWTDQFSAAYINGEIYHYDNTNWKNLGAYNNPVLNGIAAIASVATDPVIPGHVYVGSVGRGVLEIQNDSVIRRFTTGNSTLGYHTASDTGDVRVGGVAFDASGALWACNSHNDRCLSMRKNGIWTGYNIPIANQSDLGHLMVNKLGQKWMQMRYGTQNPNSILVFTDNNTPYDSTDDQAKLLNSSVGSGNIPGTNVLAMAEDKKGEIWIGTEQGIAVFYSPENIFLPNQDFDAQRIQVTQGLYVQYLMEGETVTAIAVDGANRKWIGTDRGGAFLVSEDGTKQIYHFTAENSPLLSDRITCIALNKDGDVFFGTDNGVISFRGTASEGGDCFGEVYAFPNPVQHDYDGLITVKGLVDKTQVRFTDVTGTLVYSTISEGGQATWNGTNFDGKKAHTGVYLVYAFTDTCSEKVVTKILLIH